MTRTLAVAALLALSGCAAHAPKGPWTVAGSASHEEAIQALGITATAQRLYPDSLVACAGRVTFAPDVDQICFPGYDPARNGGRRIAGCPCDSGVCVLWPHPGCPPTADISCSALAHELAHFVLSSNWKATEEEADRVGARIVGEWRGAFDGATFK